jgi:RHS repeat-associated protein
MSVTIPGMKRPPEKATDGETGRPSVACPSRGLADQRLQPTSRTVPGVLNLAASFSGPSGRNNGNVFQVADSYDATGNFTYTYDYLNRLATSTGPGSVLLQMTYDRWGNKSQAATGNGPHKPLSFLTGSHYKNRISTSGHTYDNAGNLTAEPFDAWTGRGAMTYQYDAESRIKSTGGAATATYSYDGHGRRVKKTAGGQTRYYHYDPLGNPVWEYTTLWETYNLYFNGKLVFTNTAAMGPSTVWLHTDHLGTVRVKSNASGQVIAGTRMAYFPFGERTGAKTDPVKYEFSGKERDVETGLDYFGARYYASALGRFLSADPIRLSSQRLPDPQQWALYSYVRNNPLRSVDPTGREVQVLDETALKRIRSTLPEEIRSTVQLNKKGFIKKKLLNKVTTEDENYNDLKTLVNMPDILQVLSARSVELDGRTYDFEYESVDQVLSDMKGIGVDADSRDLVPTIFLGLTHGKEEAVSGLARVTLSDGTGKAAGAPPVEHAVTTAHEIYGHGLLNLRGLPWKHDGPGKFVDRIIKEIEYRTRRLYEDN